MNSLCVKLKEIGVDVDGAITRLGGNEHLYLLICKKFIEDNSFFEFEKSLVNKNYELSEAFIHTLTGIAANLGFVRLADISKAILMKLRMMDFDSLNQDNIALTNEYDNIIHILKEI